jgi:hypothetical protein
MFGFLKKKPKYPHKEPSKRQVEECEAIGLIINPQMSSHDVWEMYNDAKVNPKYRAKYEAYEKKQKALYYEELKEEYGEEHGEKFAGKLVAELEKWEKLSVDMPHSLIIYKKGKTVTADVVELDSVDIEDASKPYVKLEILRPKRCKPRDESPYLEWEKEVSLKPQQVLLYRRLKERIDISDVDGYDRILKKAEELKAQYV